MNKIKDATEILKDLSPAQDNLIPLFSEEEMNNRMIKVLKETQEEERIEIEKKCEEVRKMAARMLFERELPESVIDKLWPLEK